jgi:hypothetical protein
MTEPAGYMILSWTVVYGRDGTSTSYISGIIGFGNSVEEASECLNDGDDYSDICIAVSETTYKKIRAAGTLPITNLDILADIFGDKNILSKGWKTINSREEELIARIRHWKLTEDIYQLVRWLHEDHGEKNLYINLDHMYKDIDKTTLPISQKYYKEIIGNEYQSPIWACDDNGNALYQNMKGMWMVKNLGEPNV